MNVVLPPRRELPPDVNERMFSRLVTGMNEAPPSRFERLRGPLAVAAGVTVIAAGALMIPQSTTGSDDPNRVGTPPTSKTSPTSRPRTSPTPIPPTPLPLKQLNQQMKDDLDRCGTVVANSPRANEFPPRESWQPVFTVELNGHRITAYREYGTKPGFCDVTATTATVSDPSAEPMRLFASEAGKLVDIDALYLSPAGILVGTATGITTMEVQVSVLVGPNEFLPRTETATVQSKLFAVHVGQLKDGDELVTKPDGAQGSGMRFEQAKVRPIGATGPIN
jgi:hypothetical protein